MDEKRRSPKFHFGIYIYFLKKMAKKSNLRFFAEKKIATKKLVSMAKTNKIIWTDLEKLVKMDVFGPKLQIFWPFLVQNGDNKIFSSKSKKVTSVHSWSCNFVQETRKILYERDFVAWTQDFVSCGNNLWILRRVVERAIEFNTPVYCVFVDYKGAFNAFNRTTLGRVLGLLMSPSMVRRVVCLYFDAKANVKIMNIIGPTFDLLRGVRQGCPVSPSFFTVALAFLSWTFRPTFKGIKLVNI